MQLLQTARVEKFKTKSEVPSIMASKKEKEMSIEDLPGIGAATGEKLRSAGFDSLMSIAVATPGEICETAGVTELTARKAIKFARDNLDMGFQSGIDLLHKRENIEKLSTGSKALDKLLGGGMESGAITECFGPYGSGKTQIGHMLAVQTQLKDPDAVAVYIDTENTFRPNRIKQFAEALGQDPEKILKNIKVARAFNSDHQMLLVEKAEELIKQGLKVKVIVVDSLTAHFRAEFVGRGTLADRQQKLNKHMHALAKLADMHNLAVYVTNQVMAKPDMFFGDPTEAIGGHIVAHNSTYRVYLRRGKKGTRVAKLVDAPDLADNECVFMITEKGIVDAE
ncbi:MAG TPA: DNA repair and recombination protein RadA [Candidatus Nanoarchaeia archaeon]|nr:DNA repair and recombination protein RadA [Candidatus Nanoarchaeia archaeon]